MIYQSKFDCISQGLNDIQDVTQKIQDIVRRSDVHTGTAHVFTMDQTGSLSRQEIEPDSQHYSPLTPHKPNKQKLDSTNLPLTPFLTIPVSGGQLVLDIWQHIFFLESDFQPRQRKIVVRVSED